MQYFPFTPTHRSADGGRHPCGRCDRMPRAGRAPAPGRLPPAAAGAGADHTKQNRNGVIRSVFASKQSNIFPPLLFLFFSHGNMISFSKSFLDHALMVHVSKKSDLDTWDELWTSIET